MIEFEHLKGEYIRATFYTMHFEDLAQKANTEAMRKSYLSAAQKWDKEAGRIKEIIEKNMP